MIAQIVARQRDAVGCVPDRQQARSARKLLRHRGGGFTIIELLVVMAIILALAGLILGTSSYVQKKGARSRAEAEIAALSTALENYKADNGNYPRDGNSDGLDPRSSGDPSSYRTASLSLYKLLSGDTNATRQPTANAKSYFSFKSNMLSPRDETQAVAAIVDPFGNSYGYSTAYQADVEKNPGGTTHPGYNPTFDLWSTGGAVNTASAADQSQWIKNW